MPLHPAHQLLADLPSFTADAWLAQMVRRGPLPPALLTAAALLPGLPGVPGVTDADPLLLQAALKLDIPAAQDANGKPEPWAELLRWLNPQGSEAAPGSR